MRRAAMVLFVAACSGGAGDPLDGALGGDAVGPDAAPGDAGSGCPRLPAPADRTRQVVVSHPYTAAGGQAMTYEVLALSADGALATSGTVFAMGRATWGTIAFTPDGEIGLVAQDDGTLGAFRLDGAGAPQVIEAGLAGSFYASGVVMDPAGSRAWVLDGNWRKNGGGLYSVAIGCDGSLVDDGQVAAAKLPYGLVFLDDGNALVAAHDLLTSTVGWDAHLASLDGTPTYLAGVDAFGDDEAIVSAAAVTPDQRFFLIGDNSAFSGIPNRIAVVEIATDSLVATQVLTPIDDPVAIVPSPFGNSVLVASGFSDALLALDYDPTANPPFSLRGELSYVGPAPQLPGHAVLIDRGMLRGRVLVAENTGVRRVAFAADGSIADLGVTSLGTGTESIVGAIGVQP